MTREVGSALEGALRRSPEDRETWRVYGDWLLEQGDARGELVGLQQKLEEALSSEERRALRAQIDGLMREHQERWLSGLRIPERARLQWYCGFIVGVSLPWNEGTLGDFEALRAHPTARLLAGLDLSHNAMGANGARVLAASGIVRSLARLELKGNHIGDDGAVASRCDHARAGGH
jgi:uncharacterized protein (TIGR02996 family)